ncbi:hypothetical protein FACS1894168_3040 [Deltaproteobacteria bacterium]|nr:hypothetical protein FACS1894168_3040 [Deltaproteobacteria bacterium]
MPFSKPISLLNPVAYMFARIAPGYDRANRILSLGMDSLWRHKLIRGVEETLPAGSRRRILDMAAGTLDVALDMAMQLPGSSVIALDFCLPMLKRGKTKLRQAGAFAMSRVCLALGDGRSLPFADASFDAVTVSFGLRNMLPRSAAVAEAYRVLVPGGTLHILEFGSAKIRILAGGSR